MNILRKIFDAHKYESKSSSYIRFWVLIFFTSVFSALTFIIFFGAALHDNVLIKNPDNTILSQESYDTIYLMIIMSKILIFLTVISFSILVWKERQEMFFRETIKKYNLDTIK